ncbi:MAG: homocysteine S-methyltransferase family protein [Bacteroidales bacterium]|nr:homocysteine S-methyltransferase family protein [Clostridium sp.]MCM1203726.1 homocysteine S-methyltransferase family protein [Bacteroidales bacterium]
MTKEQFRHLLKQKILILDGATGTNLQKAGMPTGVCPEAWILEHPDVLVDLQTDYINAGSNIIYAPTFSGNRIKLEEYGLEDELEAINTRLVELSKKAVARTGYRAYIAGNLTMTGRQLYPVGRLQLEELIEVYKEQIRVLVKAGVDLLVIETMMSLAEARAALIAAKETCGLPVIVSMTYNEDGRTLFGSNPETAVVVLQSLGADVIGINCSTGPAEMIPLVERMREYAVIPILAKPNAGMPELKDGETLYAMTPQQFAEYGRQLVEAGAGIIGGCCGTTKEHITALAQTVRLMEVPEVSAKKKRLLASERQMLEIDIDGSFLVVGERINPTGKKKLQAELREGRLDLVLQMAEEQEENGASVLDINMGMNGIDEDEMMKKVIYEVTNTVNLPLCIDSSHVDIIEHALRIYPGRALINSISLEKEKFAKLLPIAAKYGAMFILLPLSDKGLPKDLEEKKQIIHAVYDRALELGFTKEDIVVDGLVATVGANKNAALETLETIEYCKKQLGLATICGLSNISFGLPERGFVNTAFLTMAISRGLTMAIANPSQELLMNAAFASDLLLNKENADVHYIEKVRPLSVVAGAAASAGKTGDKPAGGDGDTAGKNDQTLHSRLYENVLKGNKRTMLEDVKAFLAQGSSPQAVIEEHLIPAINEVGILFDRKKYFLPQLISSAEAMELAISYVEPLLPKKENGEEMPTVIMATVEGDIHDIGKNLVVLMLKNYGYRVIDLGKDVPKEKIIEAAQTENAAIIGLSALMTTTMMRMKDVIEYAKEKKVAAKIIIGGAVITQSFAEEIGADGYSKDAAEACRLVERLLKERV